MLDPPPSTPGDRWTGHPLFAGARRAPKEQRGGADGNPVHPVRTARMPSITYCTARAASLTAVLSDGLPAVEAACAEAIAHGVHSADVVLNILARQRDPGPPATILTPAALTLRHAPVADCARYDNLRRTI